MLREAARGQVIACALLKSHRLLSISFPEFVLIAHNGCQGVLISTIFLACEATSVGYLLDFLTLFIFACILLVRSFISESNIHFAIFVLLAS